MKCNHSYRSMKDNKENSYVGCVFCGEKENSLYFGTLVDANTAIKMLNEKLHLEDYEELTYEYKCSPKHHYCSIKVLM